MHSLHVEYLDHNDDNCIVYVVVVVGGKEIVEGAPRGDNKGCGLSTHTFGFQPELKTAHARCSEPTRDTLINSVAILVAVGAWPHKKNTLSSTVVVVGGEDFAVIVVGVEEARTKNRKSTMHTLMSRGSGAKVEVRESPVRFSRL